MGNPSLAQSVALVIQKLDHLDNHVQKIEARMERWDTEKSNIIRDVAKHDHDLSVIKDENRTQWKRIDWLYRSVWVVVISQVVLMLLLFGQKFIPLIKLP